MFLLKLCVLLICVISGCFGAVYLIGPPQNRTLNCCVFNGLKLKPGESKILDTCEEVTCGTDFSMEVASCGVYQIIDPRCITFGTDITLPYPKCCQPYCVEFAKGVDEATKLRLGRASIDRKKL